MDQSWSQWWLNQTKDVRDQDRGTIVPLGTNALGREVLALPGPIKDGADGLFALTDKYLSGREYDRSTAAAPRINYTPEIQPQVVAAPMTQTARGDYLSALKSAGVSKNMFEGVLSQIKKDTSIADADLIDLAVKYRGGGERPRTRDEAIDLLSQRALEIRRDHNKMMQAKSARPF